MEDKRRDLMSIIYTKRPSAESVHVLIMLCSFLELLECVRIEVCRTLSVT